MSALVGQAHHRSGVSVLCRRRSGRAFLRSSRSDAQQLRRARADIWSWPDGSRTASRPAGSRLARSGCPAVFTLNPNVIYLQATPMTEPLLLALTTLGVAMLLEWVNKDRRDRSGAREIHNAGNGRTCRPPASELPSRVHQGRATRRRPSGAFPERPQALRRARRRD